VSEHIASLVKWALEWRADLEALKAAVGADQAKAEIRRYSAAALNYVVSRMDLVPDWEPAVGLFDDLMVVRICAARALEAIGPEEGDGGLDHRVATQLGRLANQAEQMRDFLGDDLYAKLGAYCDRQLAVAVRGRTPDQLVSDEKARGLLYAEVDDAAKRAGEVSVPDQAQAAVRLKAYLGHKLK